MFHQCYNRSAVLCSVRHYQSAVNWTLAGFNVCQNNALFFIGCFEENLQSIFAKYSRVMMLGNKELLTKIMSYNDQVTKKLKEWITMSNEVLTLVNKSKLCAQFCLIYLFISPLYILQASMWPSSGENCWIYAKLVFVTLYGWRLAGRPDATHTEW